MASSVISSAAPRYLLLLDLNGTLLLRSDKRIKGMCSAGKAGRKQLYGRPGTRSLVRQLSATGCFTLCVYTSMKRVNASASMRAILGDDASLVPYLLDRHYCRIDPQGANKWDTMRDMDKVWRLFPQFGPTSTILIDNEVRKFREVRENGIEIPEISPAEISNGSSFVIDTVRTYLLNLGQAAPADVRDYIRQYPFSLPQPTPATSAAAAASASRKDVNTEIGHESAQQVQKSMANRTATIPRAAVEQPTSLTPTGSISPQTRLYVITVEEKVVVLRDSEGGLLVTAEVDESMRSVGSNVEFGELRRVIQVSQVDS